MKEFDVNPVQSYKLKTMQLMGTNQKMLVSLKNNSMNKTTFMIITESIIKYNKMIPDRSQPNIK